MTDPIGTAQERELIERVAKAIYHTTPDLCSWDDLFEVVRERGRVKARAAIEAAGVQSRIAEVERLLDAIDWARDFEPQLVDQILDRAALSQHRKL